MGSATSKDSTAEDQSSSSSGPRRRRRSVALPAACFGSPWTLPEDTDDDDDDVEENGSTKSSASSRIARSSLVDSGASSRSSNRNAAIDRSSSNRSRPLLARIGVRPSRAISLRSSTAQSMLAQDNHELNSRIVVGNHIENEDDAAVGTGSSQNVEPSVGVSSHRNDEEPVDDERRRYDRRIGLQETLEGSVRFSRTLSVGRLRDRVLHRTSSSAGMFGTALVEDRFRGRRRVLPSLGNEVWPDYMRNHPYRIGSYDSENGSSLIREGGNHDLFEHRSAFVERRRRIRSQVRSLQRLGSRFENLSGHERSCILSGQYRTGRCTCRASNRTDNPRDETGARARISRIVMLAEALFQVLDEIHQQSAALSSRLSFSPVGSVPAPKEVVDCIAVKTYMNPQKHQNEEASQCYICLAEYEDGDFMRILPCNHEFHQTCIDKWLKEFHRVCPLCRGDVCRSEALGAESISQ